MALTAGGRKTVDPEMRAEVVSLWRSGVGKLKIAEKLGLNKITVRRILAAMVPESVVGVASGERHWSWKGGRIINKEGYAMVIIPRTHPFYASMRYPGSGPAYVLEHRLVMAEHLGRPLFPHETVHHINSERADNRIENLQLRIARHGNGVVLRCRDCRGMNLEPMPIADPPTNEGEGYGTSGWPAVPPAQEGGLRRPHPAPQHEMAS